jgi:hypothetical protein
MEENERAATGILIGVPIVVFIGLCAQIVGFFVQGTTHRFAWWYVTLMVVLLTVNVAAYLVHKRGSTRRGVLLAAWGSLVCVTAMVAMDAMVNRGDYPWILFTLHLAVLAIGETIGNGTLLPYSVACGAILLAAGVVHARMDHAFLALIFLVWATTRAMRSYLLTEKIRRLERALGIVADGLRGKTTPGR